MAEAVRVVLTDERIRAATHRLSEQVASMPGPDQAVTRLAELVSPR